MRLNKQETTIKIQVFCPKNAQLILSVAYIEMWTELYWGKQTMTLSELQVQ